MIVTMTTKDGYELNGMMVEGWQSYQEALDEQAPEYGIKGRQVVDKVYKNGEVIFNNK